MTSFEDARFPSTSLAFWPVLSVRRPRLCSDAMHGASKDPSSGASSQALEACIRIVYLCHVSPQQAFRNSVLRGIRSLIDDSLVFHDVEYWLTPLLGTGRGYAVACNKRYEMRTVAAHCRLRELSAASRLIIFLLFAFLSVFYLCLQARYQDASIALEKSKGCSTRETMFSPFIARFLSLPSHLLKIFDPLLAKFGDAHE
jgi:hypothetical protein